MPGQGWAGRGGEEITTVDKYKVLGILLSVSGSGTGLPVIPCIDYILINITLHI